MQGRNLKDKDADRGVATARRELKLRLPTAYTSPMKSRNLLQSIEFALDGMQHAFKTQRNIRIHVVAGILVAIFGVLFRLSLIELAVLGLAITIVLVAELCNTAVENLADVVSEELHPRIMVVKDVAAAAVLMAAMGAVIVGILLFSPHILSILGAG